MLPTALTLRNYRSFAGPQRLELRPLTLIYGKNGQGKSSLLRSLPLVADSLGSAGLDALSFEGREGRLKDLELSFETLQWKGRAKDDEHTIGVELHYEDAEWAGSIEWSLLDVSDWKRVLTEDIVVKDEASMPLFGASWKNTRGERRAQELSYRILAMGGQEARVAPIQFQGLSPELGSYLPALGPVIAARLQSLSSSVLWLRSQRPAPPRFTRWSGAVRWSLDPHGLDAPIVLLGEPEVRQDVAAFYVDVIKHDLLVEEVRTNEVRIGLRNRAAARFDVDMIDTGEGLAQMLPVLTALAMARQNKERGGAGILAIEDPEAFLHTDLQRALAQHVCEVARDSGAKIVLETHSQAFLLSVMRAALKGILPPEQIGIYWVRQAEDGRSEAALITLDELSRLSGPWPPDAFQEDLLLRAEIQDLRDRKEVAAKGDEAPTEDERS